MVHATVPPARRGLRDTAPAALRQARRI